MGWADAVGGKDRLICLYSGSCCSDSRQSWRAVLPVAADMINEMRGAPLLRGYRGAPVADEPALHEALLRASALVEACPEVQELDINPLRVLPSGVRALDARVRIALPMPARSRRITY